MKTYWFEKQFKYDGSQLRSLFGYLEAGQLGNSIVSWIGPCDIPFDKMIDGEDLKDRQEIRGSKMVHFIIERFQPNLHFGVSLQRLFASIVKDTLVSKIDGDLIRDGDDIYIVKGGEARRKLSISIATVCPVSTLIHFAVNVSNQGTPVPTAALEEFGIDPVSWAKAVMESFSKECDSIDEATQKVFFLK